MDESKLADLPPELERDDRFRIFSIAERAALLNQLLKKHCLIRVQTPTGTAPLLSALLFVDTANQAIVFDGSRESAIQSRLAEAKPLTLVTNLEGIRIQFQVASATALNWEGHAAFQSGFPDSILRLQRREFFRISPPLNRPIAVRIYGTLGPASASISARGIDISCGGMVLLIEGKIDGVEIGQVLGRSYLTLPEIGNIETGLEVRNIVFSEGAGRKGTSRIGCRFVDLEPADSAKVQRYINRLEVELRRRT